VAEEPDADTHPGRNAEQVSLLSSFVLLLRRANSATQLDLDAEAIYRWPSSRYCWATDPLGNCSGGRSDTRAPAAAGSTRDLDWPWADYLRMGVERTAGKQDRVRRGEL
jgi:hypothetical protein